MRVWRRNQGSGLEKRKGGSSYNQVSAGSRESRLREKAPELGTVYIEERVLHWNRSLESLKYTWYLKLWQDEITKGVMAGRGMSVCPRVYHTSMKLTGHHIPSPPPTLSPSVTEEVSVLLHGKPKWFRTKCRNFRLVGKRALGSARPLPSVLPWANHLNSMNPHFFICKLEITTSLYRICEC